MSDFIESEFADLDLGDRRRNDRLRRVLGRLYEAPMRSIKAACQGWAESIAAYRLLNSAAVTLDAVLQPHHEATVERARAQRCVAVVQDTSELDFTKKTRLQGAGPLNTSKRRGFFIHTQYVLSEGRLPLGVLDTEIYARDDQQLGQAAARKPAPIEEKESYRWLKGYRRACELAAQLEDTEVFSISEREGDIYEIYQQWHRREQRGEAVAHWIVRANQNRALHDVGGGPGGRLFEKAAEGEVIGEVSFEIKTRQQFKKQSGGGRKKTVRKGRQVRQRLLVSSVTPRPPYRKDKKLAPVSYQVIFAQEIDPPEGEEPTDWILLTSLEIKNFADARKILNLYLGRWEIEVFHRVIKTGCQVRKSN